MRDPRIAFANVPAFASVVAALVAMLVLAGWTFDIAMLRRGWAALVAMNPMTAVAFLLAGLSLWLQRRDATPRRQRAVARVAAALVAAIGALKLGAFAGWDLGIDQWLFAERLADDAAAGPNRMAPNTALNFLLLGLALLVMDWTTRRGRPAEWITSVVFLVALLALTGYAYRVREFSALAHFIPMALHTAAVFLLLAVGVFVARSTGGVMAVIARDSPGGTMARRLLPAMLLALLLVGWVRLEGERRGYYGAGLGVALYTMVNIAVFALLIWWSARSLDRGDRARRHADEALRLGEARTRAIIDTASDAFIATDAEGRVIEWNSRAEAIFGWPRDAVLGRPLTALIMPAQDQAAHQRAIARLSASPAPVHRSPVEITVLRRDGHAFPIELTAWPVTTGSATTINAFARDITQRKQAEASIQALNAELTTNAAQLQQSNRELEAFSYTVSHDLRAPLRHIDGYAQMLREDAGPQLDADMRRYLDVIGDSARRMGMLIDDLLAFSRLGRKPLERVAVDMDALVARALEEAAGNHTAQVALGPLPSTHADPILLRQVWVNLLSNAFKYSATRGDRARIEVTGQSDGAVNRYTVRDNGVGFDMRYADKLFGVFQRLHSQDDFEGTGVGLAIVQQIVSRHGGRIWAEAEPDLGAAFTMELPIVEPCAMEPAA